VKKLSITEIRALQDKVAKGEAAGKVEVQIRT